MHPLFRRLLAGRPVLTDGAWGTMLLSLAAPGEPPDALNLSFPEAVRGVAAAYAAAGCAVVLTNTFRSNRVALAGTALESRVVELNAAGVALSRAGAPGVAVFGSIGPSGKLLLAGDVTAGELDAAFAGQAAALAAAGADALVVETMADLDEAVIAVRAAKGTGLPVVASMVFGAGRAGDRTPMGRTPEEVAADLEASGADAVGANCGLTAKRIAPLCARFRAATALPVWMKPNAGSPELTPDGAVSFHCSPADFARDAAALAAAGADFVGGCCGTTPEHLRALSAAC